MSVSIIGKDGGNVEVKLEPSIYKAALDSGLSVAQYINRKYETSPDAAASTFVQMCSNSGLIVNENKEFGLKSPSIASILDGSVSVNAGIVTSDADPTSRILFPAVILEMIENKLAVDRKTDVTAFEGMIGFDTTVSRERIERPVVDYTAPEDGKSMPISQLSKPAAMMSFTVSDAAYSLPNYALGMEFSDQALRANTLDFVAMSVGRQTEVERNRITYDYLKGFLNGDKDVGDTTPLPQVKASTLDSTITANGVVSHKAWVKFLFRNIMSRRIDYCVTDLDGYLAIENRVGKPTTQTDDPTSPRVDALPTIVNRALANVKFFIVEDGKGWPANTVMGLDSRYAIHRIRNSSAAYSAVEDFVMRRSRALRFDFSEIAFRQFDASFDVLSLIA